MEFMTLKGFIENLDLPEQHTVGHFPTIAEHIIGAGLWQIIYAEKETLFKNWL